MNDLIICSVVAIIEVDRSSYICSPMESFYLAHLFFLQHNVAHSTHPCEFRVVKGQLTVKVSCGALVFLTPTSPLPPCKHYLAMDVGDDVRVTTDSDDDLDITKSVRKDLGHKYHVKSAPLSPHPGLELRDDTLAPRIRRQSNLGHVICGRKS